MSDKSTDTFARHLLIVHGDIEPELIGPFSDEDQRDDAAMARRREHGDEDGIFMLDIDRGGRPGVAA